MWFVFSNDAKITPAAEFFSDHPHFAALPAPYARQYLAKTCALPVIWHQENRNRLILRVSHLPEPQFIALMYFLSDRLAGRVAVTNYDGSWQHSLHRSPAIALAHLIHCRERSNAVNDGDEFDERALPLNDAIQSEQFGPLLEAYRSDQGSVIADQQLQQLDSMYSRYTLVRHNHVSNNVWFERLGGGFSIVTPQWMRKATGLNFEDQPNARYAIRAKDAYIKAAQGRMPIFSEVQARVCCQMTNNVVKLTYHRLLLPCQVNETDTVVLCTSVDRDRRIVGRAS